MKRSELIAQLNSLPGKDPEILVELQEPYDEDAAILRDPVEHLRIDSGRIVISGVDEEVLDPEEVDEDDDDQWECPECDNLNAGDHCIRCLSFRPEKRRFYQFSLKGWNGHTDAQDHLVKWVKAPSLDAVKKLIAVANLPYDGSGIDILDMDDAVVDVTIDEDGNVISGDIGKITPDP